MQVTLRWRCRECDTDQDNFTDTSGFGFLMPDGASTASG